MAISCKNGVCKITTPKGKTPATVTPAGGKVPAAKSAAPKKKSKGFFGKVAGGIKSAAKGIGKVVTSPVKAVTGAGKAIAKAGKGTPASTQQIPVITPGQSELINQKLVPQGLDILQNLPREIPEHLTRPLAPLAQLPSVVQPTTQPDYSGFEPIAEQARAGYFNKTVPLLAERLVGAGINPRATNAYTNMLGEHGTELERNLAALRSQYGVQQQELGQRQQQLGLGERAQNLQQLLQGQNLSAAQQQNFLNAYLQNQANQQNLGTNLVGTGLNPQIQTQYTPAQPGFWQNLLGAAAQVAPAVIGGMVGGPVGATAGSAVGSALSGAVNPPAAQPQFIGGAGAQQQMMPASGISGSALPALSNSPYDMSQLLNQTNLAPYQSQQPQLTPQQQVQSGSPFDVNQLLQALALQNTQGQAKPSQAQKRLGGGQDLSPYGLNKQFGQNALAGLGYLS